MIEALIKVDYDEIKCSNFIFSRCVDLYGSVIYLLGFSYGLELLYSGIIERCDHCIRSV